MLFPNCDLQFIIGHKKIVPRGSLGEKIVMTNIYVVFQYNWKTRAGECQTVQRCRQTGRPQFWQRKRFSLRQHFQVPSSFLFRLPWRKAAGDEVDHLPKLRPPPLPPCLNSNSIAHSPSWEASSRLPVKIFRLLFLCGLINEAFGIETISSDGRLTDELDRIWKETVVA
jgi:hypothetical protein